MKLTLPISKSTVVAAFLLIFLSLLALTHQAHAILDTNQNNVSDLWEKKYNNGNLYSTFDPAAYLSPAQAGGPATLLPPAAVTLTWPTLTWPTLAGKRYTVLYSSDLSTGSWSPLGTPVAGTGSEVSTGVTLTQPDASTPPKIFLKVAIADQDTDSDTLTDAEEDAVGSSPYFADTNGNGIADGPELRFGNNPSADTADENGDGIPDNEIYSVVFEVQQENHNVISAGPYFLPLAGSGDNFQYLTSKYIEIFSRSGAALLPNVTDARRTATYTYLSAGKVLIYCDSQIEYPPPQGSNNELGVGESDESDPTQTTVVGPTTTPAEVKTVTINTTVWRIKKRGITIRTGTQTDVNTVQNTLSDELTY